MIPIRELLKHYPDITSLESDSRHVIPGAIFVSTSTKNSLKNALEAITKGAKIIIAHRTVCAAIKNSSVVLIPSENPALDLAFLAAQYYAPLPKHCVAVTGTNGKSSVVRMVQQLLEKNGIACASIGTMGIETNVTLDKSFIKNLPSLTTLDTLNFYKTLHALKKAGVDHVAFEASSIGIDQYRCYGLPISAAAFTNFSQDHLDYHKTMDQYLAAKLKLFSEILPLHHHAVLNADSPYTKSFEKISKDRKHSLITYGIHNSEATLKGNITKITSHALHVNFSYQTYTYQDIVLPLVGTFQVENVLCALGLCLALGVDSNKLFSSVTSLKNIKGRMEHVATTESGADVYVDYAHTPEALEKALICLKEHTEGKIWVLFGCGGDRDALKRPLMGKVACQQADYVVVTDDNPRFEDAAKIRLDILTGCDMKAIDVADRRLAIIYTIAQLKKGDTLLVAGRGHEVNQIIGNTMIPFNDSAVVKVAIEKSDI